MATVLLRLVVSLPLALALCFLSGCRAEPAQFDGQQSLPPRPAVTELTLGISVQGRPIRAVRFGSAPSVVLVMAGTHGDEPAGCYVAEQLIAFLEDSPAAPEDRSVVVLPQANPDGCDAHTRSNARGVDLNRNLPAANWKRTRRGSNFSGPEPRSEPETVALIQLIDDLRPVRIISIHSIIRGRECNNYDGPAQALAEEMSRLNSYPAKATIGYPTPGSLGSWAGHDRRIPMITLELPSSLSGEQAWIANHQALLLAIGSELTGSPAAVENR